MDGSSPSKVPDTYIFPAAVMDRVVMEAMFSAFAGELASHVHSPSHLL